jgi:hypothetical protein
MDYERNARVRQLYTSFDLAATLIRATRLADVSDGESPYPEPAPDLLSQEQRHQLLELAESHLREVRRGLRQLLPYVDELQELMALCTTAEEGPPDA